MLGLLNSVCVCVCVCVCARAHHQNSVMHGYTKVKICV